MTSPFGTLCMGEIREPQTAEQMIAGAKLPELANSFVTNRKAFDVIAGELLNTNDVDSYFAMRDSKVSPLMTSFLMSNHVTRASWRHPSKNSNARTFCSSPF